MQKSKSMSTAYSVLESQLPVIRRIGMLMLMIFN